MQASTIPSRHTNPFATCWTRPGALAFQFRNGESASNLVDRLAILRLRGTIVGPHGSGKSTLLETIKQELMNRGRHGHSITLRDGQRRLPPDFLSQSVMVTGSILIIDGYEQLGWFERIKVMWHCRRTQCGILLTSHKPTPLPTLVELHPTKELVQRLVAELGKLAPTHIAPAEIDASHECHGSNVREIFFDLYDRHERSRRSNRTATGSVA